MGKQIKVITKCGEEHVYNYDQEVVSAEIVEKREYPLQDKLDVALEALMFSCVGVICTDCAFYSNDITCNKQQARSILQRTVGYQS